MDNNLPDRKGTRLRDFDYGGHGTYFITVCTEGRRHILSEILPGDDAAMQCNPNEFVGDDVLDVPQVKLLKCGEIAEKYIKQLNDFYDDISVEHYVIMPNHIHMILFVNNIEPILNNLAIGENGSSRTSTPTRHVQHATVPGFISTFKRFCNKEYGENVWQRSFYDHIIRNQHDYDQIVKYIYENPMRWRFDRLYREL